jgi:hypothetical protein
MVHARDNIYRLKDLKGKKIGLTKSLNTIKNYGGESRRNRVSN